MNAKRKIVIAGAGGIGRAVALMIRELGDFEADIYVGDAEEGRAAEATHWVADGSSSLLGSVQPFKMAREGGCPEFDAILQGADILLDCLPGEQAPRMARLARKFNTHYANMTEYVKETDEIAKIAQGADRGFILQTGLAPGFIDVLGLWLYRQFCRHFGVDIVDKISLKVGALPHSSFPPHFYGFTWSRIAVATEYIRPAVVIRDFEKCTRPSLSERATVIIKGVTYEEDLTSGGIADLPDALAGKTRSLEYKTLRYPNHYAWIDTILASTPPGEDPILYLNRRIEEEIPFVEDDIVVIFASVQGRDREGRLRLIERSYYIEPMEIGNRSLRAIQAATAAPMAECARMLLHGHFSGVILQSRIDPLKFMKGLFVNAVYKI
jgi:saccharopine dehydrogenase-like NADP-dependent oxidoreductase